MSDSGYKKMTVLILAVYIIQFLIFPSAFPKYYPRSNEAAAIFLIPTALALLFGILCFKVKWTGCLIADTVYCAAVCIYNGEGFYGIGLRGIFLDGAKPVYSFKYALAGIFIIFVLLALFQLAVYGAYRLTLKIKNAVR